MKAKIYIIKNTENEIVYYGSTTQSLNQRLTQHKSKSRYRNSYFYKSMRDIGKENFFIELIKEVNEEERMENEYVLISENFSKTYNTINGITFFDLQEIIKLYSSKAMTLIQLSKKYNTCKKTISKLLKENNVEIRDWNNEQKKDIPIEEVKKLYETGKTISEIARIFSTSRTTIYKKINLPS